MLGRLELEPLADILDRFGQDMGAETEGAVDASGLAAVDPDPDRHNDAAPASSSPTSRRLRVKWRYNQIAYWMMAFGKRKPRYRVVVVPPGYRVSVKPTSRT
jgi:hypothetical protein